MTILQRSAALAEKVRELVQAREQAARAIHFAKRAEELAGPAEELRDCAALKRLLAAQRIPTPGVNSLPLPWWSEMLSGLKDRYAKDQSAILSPVPNGEDVRAKFLLPLKQLPAKVREILKSAWMEWVQAKIPAIKDDLLTVLEGIPALRSSVQKISETKRRALEKASELPRTQADIDQVLSLASQIEQAWRSLTGDGIPDEVIEFIRVAGQPGGAPVNALSPLVLDWFRQHAIDQSLRVRVI